MPKKHKLVELLDKQAQLSRERRQPFRVQVSMEEKLKLDIINLERRLDALTEACAVLAGWVITAEETQIMTADEDGKVDFRRIRI